MKPLITGFLACLSTLSACTGVISDAGASGGEVSDPGTNLQPPTAPLVCGEEELFVNVPLRRITFAQYSNVIVDLFDGRFEPSDRFPRSQDSESAEGRFSTHVEFATTDNAAFDNILSAAEEVALQLPASLDAMLPCASSADDACAASFVTDIGGRAFRRPLEDDERTILMDLYRTTRADGGDFEEAVVVLLAAILQSPQFLYIPEIGAPGDDAIVLTPHERASRLSFFLWDSMPDEQLLEAASNGSLVSTDDIEREARRMLEDTTKSARSVRRFFREWTGIGRLAGDERDRTTYPWFDDDLARSIDLAFDVYIERALVEDWSLNDLLTSRLTPVDANLADYFDVDIPRESEWAWVELDASKMSGFLTQPAVMANLAHVTLASYVQRGHFVLENLVCEELGNVPEDAEARAQSIRAALDPTAPRRAVSDATRDVQPCGSCHARMDPLGLTLETFDATGRYRERDIHGNVIVPGGSWGDVVFDDASDLLRQLADRGDVQRCFSKQLFRYFMPRDLTERDECAIDSFGALDGTLKERLVAISVSNAFLHQELPQETGER